MSRPTDLTLSWSSSDLEGDSLHYLLYLDDKNPISAQAIAVSGTTDYTAHSLSQIRTYYWRVEAVDSRGAASLSSPTRQFTTGSFTYGWSALSVMPTPRIGVASAVANGRLYVMGGALSADADAVESYDPILDDWAVHTPLSLPRSYACAVEVEGEIHILGGLSANAAQVLHEVYDPESDSWQVRAPLPAPRSRFAAAVHNGTIYVFGGSEGALDIVAYDAAADSWQKVGELPGRRDGLSATFQNGLFYLIGGSEPNDFWLNDVSVFDPVSGLFASAQPMPSARRDHRATLVGDNIYVTGGMNAIAGHVFFANVEVYDPTTDSWLTRSRMSHARHDHAAGAIGGKLYCAGGLGLETPDILNSLEVYDPLLDQ